MPEFTKEDLLDTRGCLTVGQLLGYIKEYNISVDAPILIQRIEDRYFEGQSVGGMRGIRKDGTGGILPEGTISEGWKTYNKQDWEGESKYHPAFTPVYYKEDPEFLFINLHY